MFEKIMKAELTFPAHVSDHARSLLSNLLVRDPKQRLGSGEADAEELKGHPFFADMNWQELATGEWSLCVWLCALCVYAVSAMLVVLE